MSLDLNSYLKASAVNLSFLVVGVFIGVIVIPSVERHVYAQAQASKAASPAPSSPSCIGSATVECVEPTFTAGSAGIGTLLAGQIAADRLMVNGYDILKLQDAVLRLLSSKGVTPADIQVAINSAKVEKQLRIQIPPAK